MPARIRPPRKRTLALAATASAGPAAATAATALAHGYTTSPISRVPFREQGLVKVG
ncbi:hypothetical protein ACFOY4_21880 [Actinomadura syzygii]|uniref:hypothetical protein n=1 Tax=Actinomadura syzygii TaxID=1427538 RepID=UPI001651ECDA|nr:hypothetical protein [Actinomadura syzygii]